MPEDPIDKQQLPPHDTYATYDSSTTFPLRCLYTTIACHGGHIPTTGASRLPEVNTT